MAQLGPQAIWDVLEAQAREDDELDAAIDAVAAMSDAELDAELQRGGFDVAQLAGTARALREDAAGAAETAGDPETESASASASATASESGPETVAEAVEQVAPAPRSERVRRRRPPTAVLWLAAAATAATVGAGLYAALHRAPDAVPEPAPPAPPSPPSPVPSPAPSMPGPDLVAARELRARAVDAFALGDAPECLELLDRARELDPAGDTAPEVVALRRQATAPKTPAPSDKGPAPRGPDKPRRK